MNISNLEQALFEMRRYPFPYQRGAVFLALPLELQIEVLKSDDIDPAFFIAFKPIFHKLSEVHYVHLAANRQCDPSLLILLSKKSFVVRLECAANPSTPQSALVYLANDDSQEMCRALMSNPNIDAEIKELLVQSKEFVEISQGYEKLATLTIDELRAIPNPAGRIRFSSRFVKAPRGITVYRVELNGKLKLVDSNFDSSD